MAERKESASKLLETVGLLVAPSGIVLKIDTRTRRNESVIGNKICPNLTKMKLPFCNQESARRRDAVPHQDFYQLRDQYYQLDKLFEDTEFLANNDSLYFSKAPKKKISWKRPHVISTNIFEINAFLYPFFIFTKLKTAYDFSYYIVCECKRK